MTILSSQEIETKLKILPGWSTENDQLSKEFQLKDFITALAFVIKIGAAAEAMNHHPDIHIHSWNKVRFTLSTHSVGGVTDLDFSLAQKIEELENRK